MLSRTTLYNKYLEFFAYHSVHRESISKNSNKMTLYSTLLFPVSRSTCFGHVPCPSSGAHLTVLTASEVDKQCVSRRRRGRLTPDAAWTHTVCLPQMLYVRLTDLLMRGMGYARNM
jgi:hypothetical protein